LKISEINVHHQKDVLKDQNEEKEYNIIPEIDDNEINVKMRYE